MIWNACTDPPNLLLSLKQGNLALSL